MNRRAIQEPAQFRGQVPRTPIALSRVLLEAFEANRFQVARDFRPTLPRQHRIFHCHLHQDVESDRTVKGSDATKVLMFGDSHMQQYLPRVETLLGLNAGRTRGREHPPLNRER